jgi:hypothetical protein
MRLSGSMAGKSREFVTPSVTPLVFGKTFAGAKYWSERRDLNSGPPVPQTGALTGLRYAPNIGPHYSQRRQVPQHAPLWRGRSANGASP